MKPAEPWALVRGENPHDGVLVTVQRHPGRWAAEVLVRVQGRKAKAGAIGTAWRKPGGSLVTDNSSSL